MTSFTTMSGAAQADTKVWTLDNLDRIGGLAPRIEGHPQLIDAPLGKAIQFNGVDDAIFLDEHPLAGAETFTFEAIFRPDGGDFEQRWFHLAADEPEEPAGADPVAARFLFELRVVEDAWYLDAFVNGPGYSKALIFPERLYPLGAWYHVAQTYDGTTYRSYVDGALQGEAEIGFVAQGQGKSSIGARMNRVNYFRGAIREARFTPRALLPGK